MKITLHIPTEQYGFCEAEFEVDDMNVAAHNYRQIADAFKVKEDVIGEGLDAADWRNLLDTYLAGKPMTPEYQEMYEKLDSYQKFVIKEIKNSRARNK